MIHCRTTLSVAMLTFFVSSNADARVAGTMNFKNITSTNVQQTVNETPGNEKEVELGDIDNDGDMDVAMAVALSDFGTRRNKLYRNDNGVLVEISGAPAIPEFSLSDTSRNAFLRDFDQDGWLDLIIVNDDLSSGQAGQTKYFANQHPGGVFTGFVQENFRLNGATGAACGAVAVDLNGNGAVDLYLGNYPGPSQDTLYLNDQTGFFTEVTNQQVPDDGDYTVDIASADMNGDGTIDLLVSNHFDPNYIYYNNNLNGGGAVGDFKYNGSTQLVVGATDEEPSMEPADFDGDGRMDFYFSNRVGNLDVVFRNMGNDAANKATFTEVPMPGRTSSTESRKPTVADFNDDGRPDLVIMGENRRPMILRNTSAAGQLSFVEWAPGNTFPNGGQHAGWHAAAGNLVGDAYVDILVGGTDDDHLFVNADSTELDGAALGGVLPALYNLDPVAVEAATERASTDLYSASGIPAGGNVSVVLRGCSDVSLTVRDQSGSVVASSNRGVVPNVEEAVQFTAPGGELQFEVGVNLLCGDGDRDGDIEGRDQVIFRACALGIVDTGICQLYDFNADGDVNGQDFAAFAAQITSPGVPAVGTYVLEVLARN